MPIYHCIADQTLLDGDIRSRIAAEITAIHCKLTGAPPSFVHVLFQAMPEGTRFSGGVASTISIVRAEWRGGRPIAVKQEALRMIAEMWARETGTPVASVLASITDTPAGAILEMGHITPEPGDEAAWFARHGLGTATATAT